MVKVSDLRLFSFFIVMTWAIFLNSSLGTWLGYNPEILAMIPFMMFIIIRPIVQTIDFSIHKNKDAIYIIILAIIIFIFKISLERDYLVSEYFARLFFLFIGPMLISICLENSSRKEMNLLRKIVIAFFIVECSVAIIERINGANFFGTAAQNLLLSSMPSWEFRSAGLLGAPLLGANCVVVFMSFVVFTDMNKKLQIGLFFLGYIALFCYNSRGAILVATFFCIPYFFWKLNKTITWRRSTVIIGLCILSVGLFLLLSQTSLGGRIFNNPELIDGSAQARLDILKFHTLVRPDDLVWGNEDTYLYLWYSGFQAENGVIALLLEFGILLTIPLLFFLFRFQYRKLVSFPNIEKWLMFIVFYGIGTMNPNLACSDLWRLWVFCFYAFRPESIIPKIQYHAKDIMAV